MEEPDFGLWPKLSKAAGKRQKLDKKEDPLRR
jgi:hypothetical protein